MGDFMKKYLPIYIFWVMFIMFIATGLQISTGGFSAELPTGSEFSAEWITNTLSLFWEIISFRGDGFPAILATLAFYLPTIPVIIWIIELIIALLEAVIPF